MNQVALINSPELTVSELSAALKRTLEDAYGFVRVRGELGKVSYHSNGHVYFDLKDEKACISGVIWRTAAARIRLKLEAGLEVVVTGRITTYAGRSQYQIVVERLEPAGLGALMALIEERKRKLAAEGLFDAARKQLLPFLPDVIGVITSPTGAVIRDILHRLADRFPRRVLVWPVKVQGEGSAEQVAAAIHGFNGLDLGSRVPRPDLIIVARGGGSLEDLWSFNEESVVRAAAESMIPLISAVGHETDITLIDFAADKRAPTPTAAAEMAVPVRAELIAEVSGLARRSIACWMQRQERRRADLRGLLRALPTAERMLGERRQRLDIAGPRLLRGLAANAEAHRTQFIHASARLAVQAPAAQMARLAHHLRGLGERCEQARLVNFRRRRDRFQATADRLAAALRANRTAHVARIAREREVLATLDARAERAAWALLDRCYAALERASDLLSALSYHGVLTRGFALVRDGEGRPLRSAATIGSGSRLDIEFADGRVPAIATGGPAATTAREPLRPRRRRGSPDPGQGTLF
ncbi:MAG TPA: exodeoxyribonuclease VII large subunit [Xanthobacteraceae bacterium]|nr:exodeoxyribonuclease VII large subunit [Xanthobacteraceae bacterium]